MSKITDQKMLYTKKFAKLLKYYGVECIFGIVGIPIVTFANDLIAEGINFISCRNEQAASYAASAYGFLTNKPAVLLVVGGPGLIHSLAGIYNSMSNRWPLIVISGSNDNGVNQYKGTFQELDQISLLGDYLKFKGQLNETNMDFITFSAFNYAIQGTQGVSYIDFPGNLIERDIFVSNAIDSNYSYPTRVRSCPDPNIVDQVSRMIIEAKQSNKKILVVIGKGAVHSYKALQEFINEFNLPFLPTPMAKGVIDDAHPMNVSSTRSLVLKETDIVLVFGARLNWILHFAEEPKWKKDAIFIQCDNHPETLGLNNARNVHLSLLGDIELTVNALIKSIKKINIDYKHPSLTNEVKQKIKGNEEKLRQLEISKTLQNQLNYHNVYKVLRDIRDDSKSIIVMEGANTMDKARISFPTSFPLRRLDAGTTATMGIGLGYAMASKLAFPELDTILIQGDSAFGFSGMEIETLVRFKLGCVIVVMNNSGIYHGNDPHSSTKLTEGCRYDILAEGLGASGYLVNTLDDLKTKFKEAIINSRVKNKVTLINVIIEHGKGKQVSFAWQNKKQQKL